MTLEGALYALGLKGETLEAAGLRPPTNLDLVRSILAAWERGDYSSAEWAHPEIEFVIADGPSPGRWTGLAGLAEGAREELSAWESYRGEVDEYRELDNERVLVLHRFSARGKQSGLELEGAQTEGASLFHIRDGKVTRLLRYWNRQSALADLGLTSERRTNLERLQQVFEDFLAGKSEFGVGLSDPKIEWDSSESPFPDIRGVYRGVDAVRQFWRQWLAAWETVRFEYELRDAGDQVVALIDQRMRGRSTGIEVPFGKYAQVYTFKNGLIVHWKMYMSQSEALEAAGLPANA